MEISKLYNYFLNSTGICTDTRKFKKGSLFFALSGPNFDGNRFAEQALQKGASAVVMDNPKLAIKGANVFLVGNALKKLQALAIYHRQKLKTPLIAVTGSNGKTSTKELIREVLSTKYNILATHGNLNNHIGVPLTLLGLEPNHEIGIIEMGANHPGEIELLSEIIKPNWGFITNFGKAHLEGFGNLEGVIKSKSELYKHLIFNEQSILINGDDPEQRKKTQGYKVLSFGQTEVSDFVYKELESNQESILINFQGQTYQSNLFGTYNLSNLAAALSFGTIFNVTTDAIRKVLLNFMPENNRSQIIKIQNAEYILDAYNANPTSMVAALKSFDKRRGSNKVVVLGDMMELGASALDEHESVVNLCLKLSFDKIIIIGSHFLATTSKDERILKFENPDEFRKTTNQSNWKYIKVLIKGSRALQLEKLIPFFKSL